MAAIKHSLIILTTLFISELLLLPTALAKNSFLVAPGRVDFDLSRPKTQSFIITNNGDERIRLKIEPIYFEIDSKSLGAGTHLKPDTAQLENLTPYVRVSPKSLSLAPNQRRDIRISIRTPQDLPEGDYRSHLLVSMMETARVVGTEADPDDPNSVGMELSLKMETAVAIYGHKGKRAGSVNIDCVAGEDGLSIKLTNPTVWRLDGKASVFAANNLQNALATSFFVSLRESEKIIETELPTATGSNYEIKVDNSETEQSITSKGCSF